MDLRGIAIFERGTDMLNSTDLRSGNYVYFTIRGERSVHKLTARDIADIETMPDVAEMYSPIPVDESWLVKLGFDLYEGGYSVDNEYEKHKIYYVGDHIHDGYSIHFASCTYGGKREDTISFYYGFDYLNECQTIHHLMNLYHSLTKTELEIKS